MMRKLLSLIVTIIIFSPLSFTSGRLFRNWSAHSGDIWQSSDVRITLNPGTRYQTMVGWEATTYAKDWPGHSTTYPAFLDKLIDLAVNNLGINRVRLQIHSGAENPVDYGLLFLNGQITEREWLHDPGYDYQTVNDNDDPFVVNPAGFQFGWLDRKVEEFVLPMKNQAEFNGESLYINLCIVDFNEDNLLHSSNPEEYAEFVLVIFQHLQDKYGIVPDGLEVQLEPHVGSWDPVSLGNALVAAGRRLEANGYQPEITAPSYTRIAGAIEWFDEMVKIPGVLDYLTEFSYHRYGETQIENVKRVGERGQIYQIKTAQLEKIGADHEELFQDLTIANVSSWSQYTLAGNDDGGGAYFQINEQDINDIKIFYTTITKYLRQYFKFIRTGAVRIQADSTTPQFNPVAFINISGKYVVVIKTDIGGTIDIEGLPPGLYGIMYTTANEFGVETADILLSEGGVLTTGIPAQGVITIYGKDSMSTIPSPTATLQIPTSTPTQPVPTVTPTREPVETPTLIPIVTPTLVTTNSPTKVPQESDRPRPGCSGKVSSGFSKEYFLP